MTPPDSSSEPSKDLSDPLTLDYQVPKVTPMKLRESQISFCSKVAQTVSALDVA